MDKVINNEAADTIARTVSSKVDETLNQLLVPAMDALARVIGLGNVPSIIKRGIRKVTDWFESIIEKFIGVVSKPIKAIKDKLFKNGDTENLSSPEELEVKRGDKTEEHEIWVNKDGKVMMSSEEQLVSKYLTDYEKCNKHRFGKKSKDGTDVETAFDKAKEARKNIDEDLSPELEKALKGLNEAQADKSNFSKAKGAKGRRLTRWKS